MITDERGKVCLDFEPVVYWGELDAYIRSITVVAPMYTFAEAETYLCNRRFSAFVDIAVGNGLTIGNGGNQTV